MRTAIDPYVGYTNLPVGLYDNFTLVTPSNTEDLEFVASKFWVQPYYNSDKNYVTQWISIRAPNNFGFVFPTIGGLIDWPTRIKRVDATGTTADVIFAFW